MTDSTAGRGGDGGELWHEVDSPTDSDQMFLNLDFSGLVRIESTDDGDEVIGIDLDPVLDQVNQMLDTLEIGDLMMRASDLASMGQFAEAIPLLERVIAANEPTTTPPALLSLALAYGETGRSSESIEALERAIETGDTVIQINAHLSLGLAYLTSGDDELAVTHLQAVADSRHPEAAPRAQFFIGTIYESQGRIAEAIRAYTEACKCTDEEMVQAAHSGLDRIMG